MLLLIDNYDSFTYNLAQIFGELGAEVLVKRNDEIGPADIRKLVPERICISPGPAGRATPELVATSFVNSDRTFRYSAFASVINASAKFWAARLCGHRD